MKCLVPAESSCPFPTQKRQRRQCAARMLWIITEHAKGAKQTINGRRASEIFRSHGRRAIGRRRRIDNRKPLEADLHARSGRDQAKGRRRRQLLVRDGELSERTLAYAREQIRKGPETTAKRDDYPAADVLPQARSARFSRGKSVARISGIAHVPDRVRLKVRERWQSSLSRSARHQ